MRLGAANALYTSAILLAFAAVILRVLPPRLAGDAAPAITVPDLSTPPADPTTPTDLEEYEDIANFNIFTPNRRAPATRYVPPEQQQVAPPVAPTPSGPRLRLFGVVVGPAGTVALIDADPRIPGAEVYRPGDAVAGYRLVSVSDSAVVLEGPAGRRVLTLPSSSRGTP